MKLSKKFMSLTLAISAGAIFQATTVNACTSVLVGKNASEDGSVMISRNEDMQTAWDKRFVVIPKATHKKGEVFVSKENNFQYPIPEVTYKYTATPDWDPSSGPFEEAGINEYQLAVSATESAANNDAAKKADPFVKTGITESSIPTVLLSQSKTPKEAITLLGDIVTKIGAGEAFGLSIADANEAWYFECGSGHHWVAVKVPDDCYMVAANQLRITTVDFSDAKNYMGSSDLITFAQEKGLYDKAKDGDFNFSKVFGTNTDGDKVSNLPRVWWGENLLSPSLKLSQGQDNYPLFVKPDKKVSVKDVFGVLRSHFDGSEFDNNLEKPQAKLRAISVNSTMESHVLQLKSTLPAQIGGIHWLSLGVPETSVYVPFYSGITDTPKAYKTGTDSYDSISAYWAFRCVNALVNSNYKQFAPNVIKTWTDFEKDEFAKIKDVEAKAVALYKESPTEASKYLTDFCTSTAETAVKKANELQSSIITKMTAEPKRIYEVQTKTK